MVPTTSAPLPPPTSPRLDPPAGPPPAGGAPRPPEPGDRSARPVATWVAAVGVALVLAAASVLVVGSWNHIAPAVKLAGLVAANAVVASVAGATRRRLPAVSRAVAHLAAMMTVPSGVAVMAASHQTWPVAVTVGGACGVLACLVQSRRWRAPLLVPAAEAAGVLGLAGVAALTGAPLGLLAAGAALVAVVARRDASAGRLAGVAVAVPLLAVLGALGVGPGTALRLGARGEVLRWAAPVAGAIAAVVFAALARRRREIVLAGSAVVALATGAATGLAMLRPVATVWFGAVGALLLAVLAVTELPSLRRDGYWAPWAARAARTVGGVTIAMGALVAWPLLWWLVAPAVDVTLGWASAVWTVLAALVTRQATTTTAPPRVPAVGSRLAAASLALFAVAQVSGSPRVVLLAVAVMVGLGALVGATVVEHVALAVASAAVAVTVRVDGPTGWGVAAAGVLAVAALVAVLVARRAGRLGPVPVAVVATSATWVGAAVWPSLRWSPTFGLALAGVLVAVAGRRVPAVVFGVLAGAAATAAGSGVSTATTVGWLMATVVLTGVMVAVDSSPELEAAAIAATVVAGGFALGQPEAGLLSVAGMCAGGQLALGGVRHRRPEYTWLGALVAAGALVTLPVTSGALAWMLGALAPHGITGTDVAVGGLAVALLLGGVWFRREQAGPSSWIAYGPVLALLGTHLLTTQVTTGQVGRIAVAVGTGVVAVAVGGLRRLAAPLLGGTALVTASVVLASGHQLASLPVWVWLAVGGLGLLTVAGLIEWRAPTDDGSDGQPSLKRLWQRLGSSRHGTAGGVRLSSCAAQDGGAPPVWPCACATR